MGWGSKVSKLYKTKLHRFKKCQESLDQLKEEYDEISSDINAKNNGAERIRLERQQKNLYKRMEQAAKECDDLEAELQQFPEYQELQSKEEALQKLITILTPISLDKIIKYYQLRLPEGRIPSSSETPENLVRRLVEMPAREDRLKPLFDFVMFLLQDKSLTPSQQEDLQAWAKAQGLSPVIPNSGRKQVQSDKIETCLMVKLQPRSLNDISLGYLVSAVLVIDPDPFEHEVELIAHKIEVPNPQNSKSPAHSKDELAAVLGKLIDNCGAKYEVALTDLTVQLFLPIELMSLPIEHWQLPRGAQCCGQRCKAVIVRSYDRHFSEFYRAAKGDWKKYWNRLLDFREVSCTETLTFLNPVAGKTKIQSHKAQVLGCRFIEHHEQQQQEEFWDNILEQGLPIAFWIRHLGLERQQATGVMGSVIKKCSIASLPESLMKKRQQLLSDPSENERLKKAPFCLLWDNPFRPFPTINYQSE
jgi:hypothetical protein